MDNLSELPSLVLVVDDDEAELLMMVTTLENAGFNTLAAEDCASARRLFADYEVDIVLMDVVLPDGDGFNLTKEFVAKAKQTGRDVPIALVTGLDDVESIQIGYQCGATDFITKPVSWGTLPYRCQYLLRSSRAFLDLSVSESKTRALLSSLPDIIFRIDENGFVIDIQAGTFFANKEHWLNLAPGSNINCLPTEVYEAVKMNIEKVFTGQGQMLVLELPWVEEDGSLQHWEARIIKRDVHEVMIVMRDITQRKQQEMQMRLWAKVFEGSNESILIADAQLKVLSVNGAFEEVTGFEEGEILGTDALQVGIKLHTYSHIHNILAILQERGYWQGELKNRRKNGEDFPCWFSISQVNNTKGKPENFIITFNDITEHKNSRAKIEFLAHHDSLTGLPNRILLNDRLDMAISFAQQNSSSLGVLFIDLDRFKNVNDSLGHAVGDEIIKDAGKRLSNIIQAGDTVSRLGGDEFVLVFPKMGDAERLADTTVKICEVLREPYLINGINLHMTPSIGIAIYPDDGLNTDALIKNADAAMYLAKERGRNNFQFYTPALNARTLDRLKLENDLRQSISQGNFSLHYQPQVEGRTGKTWGAEALVRWNHPDRGLISPTEFIPLAEETGLIIPLGEWVLKEAAQQMVYWHKNGFPDLVISVNISALQFQQPDFMEKVLNIVKEAEADPKFIELELTESVLMSDIDASVETLKSFSELGYRIAIDDFGTGFSSLNYLRHLPIHLLKIDQSFVREMNSEKASLAIVNSVISLAHSLGMDTIAEGVESEDECKVLCERGCGYIQGYYFSKPMPAEQFEAWLKARTIDQSRNAM
ncbi:Cyclic di-GMP phosphodiesterase Gmr [Thalassocella blandensis]|nr:Cyclic di-GMP phosphodiesterase Gmr [Thalassocella blandensis]